jgi:cell division septal protein FtsQ
LGTATVLFLLWRGGNWFLNEFVFKNPAFAVQNIDIETDGILPKAQLRAHAGVKLGDNLLALDLSRIQRDLEYMPWVQTAAVERMRPHTLRIRVIEREPIAQTTLFEPAPSDGMARPVIYYLDAEGRVVLPLETYRLSPATFGFDTLPMITGVAASELHPGRAVESRQILAALKLIAEFSRSPMLGLVDLTTVDLSLPDSLQVSTGQGAQITFGVDKIELQLRRWRKIHDYATHGSRSIGFLDLSVSNNVPARLFEASVTPQNRPKPPKVSPYKKKHV